MIERFRSLVLGLSMLAVVGGVALYVYVALGGGETLFGTEDGTLEALDFAALDHGPDNSGYLLCDPDLCLAAKPDGPAAIVEESLRNARLAVAQLEQQNPLLRIVHTNIIDSQFDFVEYVPGSAKAHVISIRLEAVPKLDIDLTSADQTRLHIYSYRPIGSTTKGEQQDRALRFIENIQAAIR